MKKTYKLLIESPDPLNVTQNEKGFSLTYGKTNPENITVSMSSEPPHEEKKIVERRKMDYDARYYCIDDTTMESVKDTDEDTMIDMIRFTTGNYFTDEQVCTRAGRRASIMFQLMNIAEEVEKGSTECSGGWYVISRIDESKTDDRKIIIYHTRYTIHDAIASFSTEPLAQLFLDSSTDLLREWYGAVK